MIPASQGDRSFLIGRRVAFGSMLVNLLAAGLEDGPGFAEHSQPNDNGMLH